VTAQQLPHAPLPVAPPVIAEALPAYFTGRPQWVTWRYEADRKKPDKFKKVPYNPRNGSHARVNDSATWYTFRAALKAYRSRRHSGVSFVFNGESGEVGDVGADFDGCRNPATGAIAAWARPWLDRLIPLGYAEVSPSGTGIKVIVRGVILKALKRILGDHEGIEVYAWGRCFALTGQRLEGCADEPQDAQAVLDELLATFGPPEPPAPALPPTETPATPVPMTEAAPLAGDDWRSARAAAITARTKQWVGEKLEWMRASMAATTGMRHNKRLELGRLGGGLIATVPQHLSDDEVVSALFYARPPEAHVATELQAIRDGIAHGKASPLPLPFVLPTDHAPLVRDGRACCPSCSTALARSRYPYLQVGEPGWYCPRCKGAMAWPLSAWRGPAPLGDEPPGPEEAAAPAKPAGTLVHASRLGEVIEPISWLIPGLLGLNAISQLFAPGGSGKSLLALDQALCVAQVAPVIYVAAEAPGEQEERVAAWCAHHNLGVGQLYFWPRPIALKDPASVAAFSAEVRAVQPALIVLDPLAACMVGLEESVTGDMAVAVDALNRIREATGAAVNVVHHTGWSTEHERGSSVLRNACRVVVKLAADDSGLMTLTWEKANNGKPVEARYFRLVEANGSVVPIPASKATTRNAALTLKHIAILEALSLRQHADGASFTQVLDYTEQGKSTLHKGINRLLERGLITRERQTYTLTEDGQQELAATAQATAFAGSPTQATSELRVNWAVNIDRTSGELRRQDAEFTEFTVEVAPVHPAQPDFGCEQFTMQSASACSSSPQFTPSSPSSSPSRFTSSPPTRSLERGGSELNQSEPGEQKQWGGGAALIAEGELGTSGADPTSAGAGGHREREATLPTARAGLPAGWQLYRCDVRGWLTERGSKWLARGPSGEQIEPCDSEVEAMFWARRRAEEDEAARAGIEGGGE